MNSQFRRPLTKCLALLICLELSTQVLAQTGDGGGAAGVQPGEIGAAPGPASAGAQGTDAGSVNLSRGATIAICVVVSVVVILGVAMTALFFTAKRRQWTMKETIRRSAKKVGSTIKAVTTPITPKKMTFSPVEKRQRNQRNEASLKKANDELCRSKSNAAENEKAKAKAKVQESRDQSSSGSDMDLEKGVPEVTVKIEPKSENDSSTEPMHEKKDRKRPRPPSVTIPSSAFEMDSPKTPVWKKVFGR